VIAHCGHLETGYEVIVSATTGAGGDGHWASVTDKIRGALRALPRIDERSAESPFDEWLPCMAISCGARSQETDW
jgi:hypothetical protein